MPDRGRPEEGHERPTVSLTKLRLRVMADTGSHQIELVRFTERDFRELHKKRIWVEGRKKGKARAGLASGDQAGGDVDSRCTQSKGARRPV